MMPTSVLSPGQHPPNSSPCPRQHPRVLDMVLEALQAADPRRAMLAAAIKVFILQKYPTVNALRLPHLLRRALDAGLSRGLLARPPNSKARGATGSFKVSGAVPPPRCLSFLLPTHPGLRVLGPAGHTLSDKGWRSWVG